MPIALMAIRLHPHRRTNGAERLRNQSQTTRRRYRNGHSPWLRWPNVANADDRSPANRNEVPLTRADAPRSNNGDEQHVERGASVIF